MQQLKKDYKHMKKIIYLFLITAFLSSCSDDYVDILPFGSTIPENTDDLAMMLNVTNDINSGGGNYGNQADDVVFPADRIPFINESQLSSYTWTDFMYKENESDSDWADQYKAISRANYVISNINAFEVADEYNVDNTKGRAHFIRANALFYLVNGYAKHYNASNASTDLGVPLPLELDINVLVPRSTVQETYDLIISDLETALPLLPDVSTIRTWASKQSVYALLGRVYLYQEKYELSVQNSKAALDLGNTLSDYNSFSLYDPTNPAKGIAGYDSNKMSNEENIYVNEGYRNSLFLSDELVAEFNQVNDLRFRYFISKTDQSGTVQSNYIPVNADRTTWSGIRMPEIYLNYCEALMKQASPNSIEAIAYLNKFREKRYDVATYAAFTHADDESTLAEIMLERRRELRLTAWRWFDMKRLGLSHTRIVNGKTYTINASSANYVWAIPLNVIAINPLEQNERGL